MQNHSQSLINWQRVTLYPSTKT